MNPNVLYPSYFIYCHTFNILLEKKSILQEIDMKVVIPKCLLLFSGKSFIISLFKYLFKQLLIPALCESKIHTRNITVQVIKSLSIQNRYRWKKNMENKRRNKKNSICTAKILQTFSRFHSFRWRKASNYKSKNVLFFPLLNHFGFQFDVKYMFIILLCKSFFFAWLCFV